jgi:hypothetical protein
MSAAGSPSVFIINLVKELMGVAGFNAGPLPGTIGCVPNRRGETGSSGVFDTALHAFGTRRTKCNTRDLGLDGRVARPGLH